MWRGGLAYFAAWCRLYPHDLIMSMACHVVVPCSCQSPLMIVYYLLELAVITASHWITQEPTHAKLERSLVPCLCSNSCFIEALLGHIFAPSIKLYVQGRLCLYTGGGEQQTGSGAQYHMVVEKHKLEFNDLPLYLKCPLLLREDVCRGKVGGGEVQQVIIQAQLLVWGGHELLLDQLKPVPSVLVDLVGSP